MPRLAATVLLAAIVLATSAHAQQPPSLPTPEQIVGARLGALEIENAQLKSQLAMAQWRLQQQGEKKPADDPAAKPAD